jgi:hypothetical protein
MAEGGVFTDLGEGADQDELGFFRQWAKNLKFKSDGKANPRGIATNVISGINPMAGLAASLPYRHIGDFLKDLLGIGPDNKLGVMDLGKEGSPSGVGGDASGMDVASVLGLLSTTPGVDESLGPISSFAQAQQGPSGIDLFTQLLNDAGYFSATGNPLDPSARTVAVGAGTDRSFDRFGGGRGPGAGLGGPGGGDLSQFFGGGGAGRTPTLSGGNLFLF